YPHSPSVIISLSLHDALPIFLAQRVAVHVGSVEKVDARFQRGVHNRLRGSLVKSATEIVAAEPDHGSLQRADSSRRQFLHVLSADRKSTRLNSSHVSISYAVF